MRPRDHRPIGGSCTEYANTSDVALEHSKIVNIIYGLLMIISAVSMTVGFEAGRDQNMI